MKRLTETIANMKISSKIRLCMLTIALTLSLFLGIFSSRYFTRLYQEDSYVQTADSLQIGSQSLGDSYHILLNNVINFASSKDFLDIVHDVRSNNHQNYGKNKAAIQNSMSHLALNNALLDSMSVIGKNGEFYTLFTNTLKKEADPSSVFGWDLSSVNGITWLPLRPSPFIKNNDIVPVILPIALLDRTLYLNVTDNPKAADVLIVLMLDGRRISQRLALSHSSYSDRTLYVADASGQNISLEAASPFYGLASSPATADTVRINSTGKALKLIDDNVGYSLYSQDLGFSGLKLVSVLPKDTLHRRIAGMNTFILLIAFLGLTMATFLSLLLSRFVTKPFQQLIANVKNIENNCYDTPHQMKYQDEIGCLNMAINSMYATIQQQFQRIKQSERDKYRSEIQLLSEQINPHFLYNTLECINMEVLGGHREAAASMITSLGDFLRIGLSYGNELIPITKEILHVKAYIDIMNHRFNRKTDFHYDLAPELENLYVLKSILQPLAENSIRHGFDANGDFCDPILLPAIVIRVTQENSHIILEMTDNGRGIDIEKATSALHPDSPEQKRKQHVGLLNIYQRLTAYYTDVDIAFETIPYYKNTVRLTLPYES